MTENLPAPNKDDSTDIGEVPGDDSNLLCSTIIAYVLEIKVNDVVAGPDGSLIIIAKAGSSNFEEKLIYEDLEREEDGVVQSEDVNRVERSKEVLDCERRKH